MIYIIPCGFEAKQGSVRVELQLNVFKSPKKCFRISIIYELFIWLQNDDIHLCPQTIFFNFM